MTIFLPCLLERWSTAPDNGRARGGFSNWQDVKRDVLRNLEWLLNTEQEHLRTAPERGTSSTAARRYPPAVERSVLCFGIPAFSGQVQSSFERDAEEIAWAIRERIVAFEPRINAATLSVTLVASAERGADRVGKVCYVLRGELRADPLPIEFSVETEFDLDQGRAQVRSL